MSERIVLCKCGKATTEDDAFPLDDGTWICKECLLIQEAMAKYAAEPKADGGGVKHDQSKLRFDLIPPALITYDAAIYTIGAAKYADDNWRRGMKYRRLFGACVRHMMQRCLGEVVDSESRLPHLAHARWNLGAMLYYDLNEGKYKGFDDLTDECAQALTLFSKME